MKKDLPTVTLLGVDCVNIDRLVQAAEICMENFNFAEVKLLTSLPTENIENIVPINKIESIEEYSRFMISELSDYVETEYVLIIQYDGFILNPDAWTDDYLLYDYIGSPLLISEGAIKSFGLNKKTLGDWVNGNGGFCLRSKKLLEALVEMDNLGEITEYNPEDIIICVKIKEQLEARGIQFAPLELAERFSFEYETINGKIVWSNEFGFHGLRWSDISPWIKKHPKHNIKNPLDRDIYLE